MRGVILVDTGPLYALTDPDDALHERAGEEREVLKARRLVPTVPYSNLIEGHALVLRKLGLAPARRFLRDLTRSSILVTPAEGDHEGAIRRVLRYPDQAISLADAVLAEMSARIDAPVWTYDHHFDVMGVNVWRQ